MIRRLTRSDVPAVVDMIGRSFAKPLWPYMTYTQAGAAKHLDVAVRYPSAVEPRYLIVAEDDRSGQPIGFADFKLVDDRVGFLSYICVDQAARGRGLATAMFRDFLRANPEVDSVSLDTFRDNAVARALYERWGFTAVSSSVWVTRRLPVAGNAPLVPGLAVSLAALATYGFCELRVRRDATESRVGVMGESVLRCFDAETFEDDELLAGVRGLMPELELAFAVLPESQAGSLAAAHDVVLVSDRMTCEVGTSGLRRVRNEQ
ncbi:GNAT family N-acetyltransferase [Leifsonia sp. AG29]|uniref:GNAT family N-acetyltransferase n=1 Tax=Leifsonia sp. AG29 TaxID=2598860 RepID=UPI00131A9ABA|nr:GNAT family N-acetyltransferase [Leifsonia sp. AG29]